MARRKQSKDAERSDSAPDDARQHQRKNLAAIRDRHEGRTQKECAEIERQLLSEFQEAFGVFFPALLTDPILAHEEMIELIVLSVPPDGREDVVRRAAAESAVIEACAALQTLGNLDESHAWLWAGSFSRSSPIVDFIRSLDRLKGRGRGALNDLLENFKKEAFKVIEAVPERGSIRWDSVRAVALLRGLWRRRKSRAAPHGVTLNESSEYGRYIVTGFEFLALEASPRAAVRAWHQRREAFSIFDNADDEA